jgi:hypothetical protein
MGFSRMTNLVIVLVIYLYSCQPLKNKRIEGDYLPDLKIQEVRYTFFRQESVPPKDGPKMTIIRPETDLEFYIVIKNIGTADWDDDLCIYYTLDAGWKQGVIRIAELKIPYALDAEVSFKLKILERRPKTATIIINPAETDSTEGCIFVKEPFQNNNIYQIDF